MALVSINYARAGITGSFNGATLICQRKRDETGAVQAKCTAGTADVVFQGRLSDQFSFMDITDGSAQYSISSGEQKIFADLPILPQVRTRVENASASTVIMYVMQ